MKTGFDAESGLAFIRAGKGPAILLVHGFPLDSSMWHGQIGQLAESSTVIAADLAGFGGSELREATVSMDSLADRLARMLPGIGVVEPVVFCGHSMGGYVGWSFLRRHREKLRGLVLCHTRSAADSEVVARGRRQTALQVLESGAKKLVDDMLGKLLSRKTGIENPHVMEQLQAIMNSARLESVAAALLAMAGRVDSTQLLPQIDFPVLVVAGDHDQITPVDEMREMAEKIPGSTFETVAGTAHLAPMERPEEFNRIVAEFLSRL